MTYITSLDPQPAVLLLEILGGAIGPMGPQGPVGPPNAGVFIKGIADTWPPTLTPKIGDLYVIPDPSPTDQPPWVQPGHGAFWDGAAWVDAGLLRGPTGLRGEPGPPLRVRGIATFWPPDLNPMPGDIWSLPDPPPPGTPPEYAKEGATGWDDATGQWIQLSSIRGPAGRSVEVYGPSQLPPSPTNTVLYKGDLWLSDGSYPAGGSFDPSLVTPGAKGDKGDPGQAGTIRIVGTVTEAAGTPASVTNEGTASAAELRFHIPQGPQGIQGIQGVAGNAGPQGPAGDTFKVSGAVANEASLPATPPNLAVYITQVDSHLHIYDPTSAAAKPSGYVDLGAIAGPQGASAFVSSPVTAVADLPAAGSAGQMIICLADGHVYGWDAGPGKWVDGGMIRGPQGVAGHGTIEDGTVDKQIAVWSVTNGRWEGADNTLQGLKDVRFPAHPVDGQLLTWKTDHWEAGAATGRERLSTLDDVDLTTTAPQAQDVLGFNGTKWVPKSNAFVPLFRGTYSVGSKSGSTYTPPNSPKEGDIWVDKNQSPPVFKVYRGGAWVLVNWQTDSLGLLSDLANVNVGASGSPGQGDALIFNQLTEQWESGSVPAHIAEYGNTINYSAGTTVYYKGGLFEARERTTGVSPAFQYGDCWLYHRAQFNGSGDWVGPVSFETVTQVADVTVPPSATHAADDLRPHWTLLWKDDANFSVWSWELSMKGWSPGMALPTAQWHRYETQFTKPNAARIWRNYSTPPQHVGDCVVWVYDDPKGTNVPHYRDFPWILRPIRSDLISMHDVQAENPTDQSILIWNTATSYWEAKPNPSYTKTEVDAKFASVIAGLSHEESVLDIISTPPASPAEGEIYIIGTGARGAWAGHDNEVVVFTNNAWKFVTPSNGETHLVEATRTMWSWSATASKWVKIAETGLKMQVISQADYDALAVKDAQTLYLIQS